MAPVFSWQLCEIYNNNFFNTKLTLKRSIVIRNVDQISIGNLITQPFNWNFDNFSVFQAMTAGYTKAHHSEKSLKVVINTLAIGIWRFLTCQNCQMICMPYYWDKQHANITPLIVLADLINGYALFLENFSFLECF